MNSFKAPLFKTQSSFSKISSNSVPRVLPAIVPESIQYLNRAQQAAILAPSELPLEISGGPGVGKTKSLAERAVQSIVSGISPKDIVVLSHTPLEANSLAHHIDHGLSKFNVQSNFFWKHYVSFFCVRMLHLFGYKIGLSSNFFVLSEQDKLNFVNESLADSRVKTCLRNMGYFKKPVKNNIKDLHLDFAGNSYFNKLYKNGDDLDPLYISLVIENIKSGNSSISQWVAINSDHFPAIARVLVEYESRCKKTKSLDMNDLVLYVNEIIDKYPDVVKDVQSVFVDGAENITGAEYQLVSSLAKQNGNITVSGDQNKIIHPFSMASPIKNLLGAEHSKSLSSVLWTGYRLTKPIAKLLENIADNDLTIKPRSRTILPGPYAVDFTDPFQKSSAVASFIKSQVEKFSGKASLEYRDFSVLESQSDLAYTQEAFEKHGVPYKILGNSSFWSQKEIAMALHTLRVIQSPDEDRSVVQLLRYMDLNVDHFLGLKFDGSKCLTLFSKAAAIADGKAIVQLSKKKKREIISCFVEVIRKCSEGGISLENTLNQIITGFGLDKTPEGKKSTDKLVQLIKSDKLQKDFNSIHYDSNPTHEITKFLQLQAIGQISVDDYDDNKVTLSTPYDAQGQAWPIVFSHFEYKNNVKQSLSQLYSTVSCSKAISIITLTSTFFTNTSKSRNIKNPLFASLKSSFLPIDRVAATRINALKNKNSTPK
ncbi:uncharacterized protein SAPINGB_P003046 [Magnusiomyces paraingens]|uniref:DNA 3'-5' helicase n=1 Tax=Magnusiomyces paraingens TaxID=2606893 RepID=A0A5E8BHX9_9ASCO|nr:uncharacterized protein SAPINGB_P003046 [Saprochaete ingens]VVT51286.1 unnamed protein product [Saprochaete ingens]